LNHCWSHMWTSLPSWRSAVKWTALWSGPRLKTAPSTTYQYPFRKT